MGAVLLRKAFIISFDDFYDFSNGKITVGGIQTYLVALGRLLRDIGYDTWIVQRSDQPFVADYEGVSIRGVVPPPASKAERGYRGLFTEIEREVNAASDLIIWSTDAIACALPGFSTIAIQHGIAFDLVPYEHEWRRRAVEWGFGSVFKLLQRRRALKFFAMAKYRVCVDYNFLNWYRTFSLRDRDEHIFVIPNFSDIPEQHVSERTQYRRFLFARRFVEKRGVRIVLGAAERLLADYPDVEFVFAGEGPLEGLIRNKMERHPRVTITKYEQRDVLGILRNVDVALIPTIGSEGTSLSLLEAMAAGCAVICSNVGGMTNIVIDEYNGLMVEPTLEELYKAMVKVYNDPLLGNRMARRGRETVEAGFSLDIWRKKWVRVIDSIRLDRKQKVVNGSRQDA